MSDTRSGTRCVSLFVPELLSGLNFLKDISKQDIPELPALQLLFSRASKSQDGYENLYRGVCDISGIQVSSQQDLPLAAITISAEKKTDIESNTDYFIFAEPVAMQADRDSLVLLESLLPNNQNSLSRQESELLIAEVNLHFINEPWQLLLTEQGVWYLNLKSKRAITTTPISNVILKNTQHYIPVGEDARYWRQIINEIEMLFFASAVNAQRLDNNKIAVSSLWLWGGGILPTLDKKAKSNIICGEEYLLQSISKFIDAPYKSLSSNLLYDLISATEFNDLILVDSGLKDSWLQRDLYSWINALKNMEQELFKPALTALRKGKVDSIVLFLDAQHKLQLTARGARRWWKPVKRLEAISNLL